MSGLKGKKEFERALKDATQRITRAVAAGVYGVGNNIIGDAKENAPKDTGTLADSGYCTLPQYRGSDVICEVGFGGWAEAYAVKQHETHKTKSKYLQKAMDAAKASYVKDVHEIAQRAFKQNKGPSKSNLNASPWQGKNMGKGGK